MRLSKEVIEKIMIIHVTMNTTNPDKVREMYEFLEKLDLVVQGSSQDTLVENK